MKKLQYLTEKEVAELTGFSLQTLRNWRHVSRGPSYLKVSRSIRYRMEDVTAYMERNLIDPEGSL